MFKIAICDDNKSELDTLSDYIDAYRATKGVKLDYECFSTGTELLARIEAGAFYDLIFLDIVMPAINGIEIAKEIYAGNKVTQMVFLTASKEFAVDSYSVSALDYILKPIDNDSFRRAMKRFEERHEEKADDSIIIQEKSSIMQIRLNTICYVEAFDHYQVYHLSNGEIIQCRQNFGDVVGILRRSGNFVRTHRSYIVNMNYIMKLETDHIIMSNGDRVSVSRARSKTVADFFLKYKFGNSLGGG